MKNLLVVFMYVVLTASTCVAQEAESISMPGPEEAPVPDGLVREYYSGGALKGIVTYENGKREGSARSYHDNGNLEVEMYFKNDLPEGTARYFDRDGKIQAEHLFREGKLTGVSRMYDLDGTLWEERGYRQGVQHGITKGYYKNNSLKSESMYEEGILVWQKGYDEKGKLILQRQGEELQSNGEPDTSASK
ncbi:toxin-antitoxin system YwqK family antitoxin [Candidatus Omnitrophota bacterium]